ncbi:hypothetical protein [Enterococcus alishanensis]
MSYLTSILRYISRQERDQRAYEKYSIEHDYFKDKSREELEYFYIEAKVEYEYAKNRFNLFGLTLCILIIGSIWGKFSNLIQQLIEYMLNSVGILANQMKVTFYICIIVMVVITIFLLMLLIVFMRSIKIKNKKLLIIKVVLEEQGWHIEDT